MNYAWSLNHLEFAGRVHFMIAQPSNELSPVHQAILNYIRENATKKVVCTISRGRYSTNVLFIEYEAMDGPKEFKLHKI